MDEKNKNNISPETPKEKRSIRNIPLTKKQAKELEKIEEEMVKGDMPPPPLMPPPVNEAEFVAPVTSPVRKTTRRSIVAGSKRGTTRNTDGVRSQAADIEDTSEGEKTGGRSNIFWLAAAVITLVLIYGIAHYFTRATVTIVQAEEVVVLSNDSFNLSSTTSTLPISVEAPSPIVQYQKSVFNITSTTTVSATGLQTIQKKATGKIVVYNDSTTSQLLIATSRFQTPEGLIFHLNKNVTVPAKKNVTVEVTAAQPGEKYNIGPKTFTLPALSNTAKAKTVYGKSSTSMTGGSITSVPQAAADDLSAAKVTLQNNIHQAATEKALAELPEGYVFVANSLVITPGEIKQTYDQASKTASLTQTAAIGAYYLEKRSLSSAIASKSTLFMPFVSTADISIDTESLVASIPVEKTPATFTLTGTSTVKSTFDPIKISNQVAGLTRNETLATIKSLPGVEAVEISLRPWWERRLPKQNSIKIIIE